MTTRPFVSSMCMLSGRPGLVSGASRAGRWPARRGTSRGTGGREIPVQSVLQAQFAVLFMQVAALRRARVPLVKRRLW